jgi:hypothetical protein
LIAWLTETFRGPVHLAGIHRQPQLHTGLDGVCRVVAAKAREQSRGQLVDQPDVRELRRDKDQRAITPVLRFAFFPTDSSLVESRFQDVVQPLVNYALMQFRADGIGEPGDVDDEDRAMPLLVDGKEFGHRAPPPRSTVT